MQRTTNITLDIGKFSVTLEEGKYTVHPDSQFVGQAIPDNILHDSNMPLEMIACYDGKVLLKFPQEKKDWGTPVERRVGIRSRKGLYIVTPDAFDHRRTLVKWHQNWLEIECTSRGHAQHVIEKLVEGEFESALRDSKVIVV